jgi:hypothetical protein
MMAPLSAASSASEIRRWHPGSVGDTLCTWRLTIVRPP